MEFLDYTGLNYFLEEQKKIFGNKAILNQNHLIRQQYLLNIDYDSALKFDTNWIVGDNAPYVGSAIVGQTYVA